jgi:hypothetical protein
MTVAVRGTPPFHYQWARDGIELALHSEVMDGTTHSITPETEGTYTCRVTNTAATVLSTPSALTIFKAPAIRHNRSQGQPQSVSVGCKRESALWIRLA